MLIKLQCLENVSSSFYVNSQHIAHVAVYDDGSRTSVTTVDGHTYEAAGDVLDVLISAIDNQK